MQTISNELIEAQRRDRMQACACEALDRHYSGCRNEIFNMLSCDPDVGSVLRAVLDGSQHEFERITQALTIARASLGLEPAGHA